MNQSETLGNLAMALSAVQGELRPAEENARNPFFKSQYADLGSIIKAARHLLAANGLSVSQFPGPTYCDQVSGNAHATLTTILMHESGEWLSQDLSMPLAKVDPQGYGSAITYARRYALASVLGIVAGEDDDGNGAADKQKTPQRQQASTSNTSNTITRGGPVKPTPAKPAQAKVVNEASPEHPQDDEPTPAAIAIINEPLFNGKTADARAWLEEKGVCTLGVVADALVMTGLYNDRHHVTNALSGVDGAELREKGLKVDLRNNVKGTLMIFDWGVERKQVEAE